MITIPPIPPSLAHAGYRDICARVWGEWPRVEGKKGGIHRERKSALLKNSASLSPAPRPQQKKHQLASNASFIPQPAADKSVLAEAAYHSAATADLGPAALQTAFLSTEAKDADQRAVLLSYNAPFWQATSVTTNCLFLAVLGIPLAGPFAYASEAGGIGFSSAIAEFVKLVDQSNTNGLVFIRDVNPPWTNLCAKSPSLCATGGVTKLSDFSKFYEAMPARYQPATYKVRRLWKGGLGCKKGGR